MESRSFKMLLQGLIIAVIQFCVIYFISKCDLKKFINFDGGWYAHILQNGYRTDISADPSIGSKGNIGFFPGFPLMAYGFKAFFGALRIGFTNVQSLVLTAFSFSVVSWTYLSLWVTREVGVKRHWIYLLFCALYPFSFFMVLGYTEALFLSMTIGFFVWTEESLESEEWSWKKWSWLVIHGFIMCFTRFTGFVFVLYPVVRAIQLGHKKWPRYVLASLLSASAMAVFFCYLKIKFGQWDLYFVTEKKIWGTFFDPSKLWPPVSLFDFKNPLNATNLGKYVTLLNAGGLAVVGVRLLKSPEMFRRPIFPIWLTCGMFWGVNFLARTSLDYQGMGRYLIPGLFISMPYFFDLGFKSRLWILFGIILLAFQLGCAMLFLRGGWVA